MMNERAEKTYKSPRRKLVRFFEKSRDQWKAKCLQAKGLKHRIRYLEQSKAHWKAKAKELEQELAQIRAQQERAQCLEADKKNG